MTMGNYGGFWRRVAAIIIDKIILYLLFVILLFAEFLFVTPSAYAPRPGAPTGIWSEVDMGFLIRHYAMGIVIAMIYFIYFHGALGQTPGKLVLGLKVVRASGKKMTYGIAFLRWIGYIVATLPLCLGFLWVAFDRRNQGWHDKIADTFVVRETQGARRTGSTQLTMNI